MVIKTAQCKILFFCHNNEIQYQDKIGNMLVNHKTTLHRRKCGCRVVKPCDMGPQSGISQGKREKG